MLSIPFNKLPPLPDKKPTVFVREHSLKLQQSWSRISAGNKCIWACNLYSILIVFCLFFLCLIVYYTNVCFIKIWTTHEICNSNLILQISDAKTCKMRYARCQYNNPIQRYWWICFYVWFEFLRNRHYLNKCYCFF